MNDHDLSDTPAQPKADRNKGLSQVLRQLRRRAKVSQATAAEAMGLERTSMCNIEGGSQTITIEKLHEFAQCIGHEVTVSFKPKRKGPGSAAVAHVLSKD